MPSADKSHLPLLQCSAIEPPKQQHADSTPPGRTVEAQRRSEVEQYWPTIGAGQDIASVPKIEMDDASPMHLCDRPLQLHQECPRKLSGQRAREQNARPILDDQGGRVELP